MTLSHNDLTLGAVLLGALIGSILYGVVTVQLYIYSGRCRNDPMWLISFVYTIWVLETVLTVLSICYIYDMIIVHFGDAQYSTHAPWMMNIFEVLQVLVGISVQSFFAYRVYRVSNSLIFPCMIWSGAIVRLALSITIAVLGTVIGDVVVLSKNYGFIIKMSISVSVASDLLNMLSLTWALVVTYRKELVIDSTSRMVDKLVLYSVETGLITSMTGVCMLVSNVSMTDNLVWLGILEFYAKLYSNTLMASLNARARLRNKYMINSSVPATRIHGWPERSRINVQTISSTETGEPGQKQPDERDTTQTVEKTLDAHSRPNAIVGPVVSLDQ